MNTVPQSAIDNWGKDETPAWAHALVTALITGEPLDFGGSRVPADIVRRLAEAADANGGHVQPQTGSVMLDAVKGDIERLALSDIPGGHTHAAIALHLAGVIDKRGADDGPSVTAKLADQLGKAMQALTRKGGKDDDGFSDWEDALSEPVVDK